MTLKKNQTSSKTNQQKSEDTNYQYLNETTSKR